MTPTETMQILTIIAASYQKFELPDLPKEDDQGDVSFNPKGKMKFHIWHKMLKDLDFDLAQAAVEKLIAESPYPPSISDVRKRASQIINSKNHRLSAADAWGEVEKAIRFHGRSSEQEALESMSPLTARVVKCMGWRDICNGTKLSVTRGQFLKMYKQLAQRQQQEAVLPSGLKKSIDKLADSMSEPMAGNKNIEANQSKVVELISDIG